MSTGRSPDATQTRYFQAGAPRPLIIKLLAQAIITQHEDVADDGTVVATTFSWRVMFQGREVESSLKREDSELLAQQAATRAANAYAARVRQTGGMQ